MCNLPLKMISLSTSSEARTTKPEIRNHRPRGVAAGGPVPRDTIHWNETRAICNHRLKMATELALESRERCPSAGDFNARKRRCIFSPRCISNRFSRLFDDISTLEENIFFYQCYVLCLKLFFGLLPNPDLT